MTPLPYRVVARREDSADTVTLTLEPVEIAMRGSTAAAAVFFGSTRLIDNIQLT